VGLHIQWGALGCQLQTLQQMYLCESNDLFFCCSAVSLTEKTEDC
jgi:hypothetical protein